MAQTITGSTGKTSALAYGANGALVLEHTITGGTGIPSGVAFGSGGALLQESSPGAGLPAFSLFIEGVDRTGQVLANTVTRAAQLGSRASAAFRLQDPTGTYQPSLGAEVQIYRSSTLFFAGSIESLDHQYMMGTDALTETAVRCTDYGVLCDRRIIARFFDSSYGLAATTFAELARSYLSDTGIWYEVGWQPETSLGEQLFNYCTVAEAFNQVTSKVNGEWRVDFNKRLWLFPKSTGYMAAPVSITDNDGNLMPPVVLSRTRSKYANRVGVRNNLGRKLTWTDTHTPAGDDVIFETTFRLDYKPIVTLDGVPQIVLEGIGVHTEDWDFDYSPGSYHLNANYNKAWPDGTLVISYPCTLSFVHWAEDAAEIAAKGTYELVDEVKDLSDDTSLDAYVAGLLARYKTEPVSMTFRTRTDGFEPGQLLTVDIAKPVLDDTLLIESVNSQEQYCNGTWEFVHTVKASNAQRQYAGDPIAYFGKLIERGKQPQDRLSQTLRFNVASTVAGLTNPGLEVREGDGGLTAERDGVLGEIRLTFKSIEDGIPTTGTIELDVYQNGTSVFDTERLVLPAGDTATATQWIFASDPQSVAKGDRFTFAVLQADSAAKDGILEINIIG